MEHIDRRRRNGPVTSRQATPEELRRVRGARQANRKYLETNQGITMFAHVIPQIPAEAFAVEINSDMIFGQKQQA